VSKGKNVSEIGIEFEMGSAVLDWLPDRVETLFSQAANWEHSVCGHSKRILIKRVKKSCGHNFVKST
jgi:hypothetical protein